MNARFTRDSTSGAVSRGANSTLTLDASSSEDPSDPSNAIQAMRWVWVWVAVVDLDGCG
jgi:hypothetical protein